MHYVDKLFLFYRSQGSFPLEQWFEEAYKKQHV